MRQPVMRTVCVVISSRRAGSRLKTIRLQLKMCIMERACIDGTSWNLMELQLQEVGHVQKLFGLQLKMCRHHGTLDPQALRQAESLDDCTRQLWPDV
jgi:hypothetical protein